ncbi:hypothetical protein EV677_0921 [Herminiimonas fonticola]|uniref:Uncharacterized protein n=1 Tax=Herminiimonas fonticola TaxID=303380 RepID=A0A4R6GHQ7_9BURK|nr:hypothetical protein Hfont_0895 [Herminiimonas fonticola]TDN94377.1 hypothetical protein EV677_0921 [Herminiimonas fonticola]
MSYGKKYQCETANGAIPYYFKGYSCEICMESQNRDDIPLESPLRVSCYKNHLFMGWYFPPRELGYSLRWFFFDAIVAQGAHRETACYIRLDCGLYRYRGYSHLLCQPVATA